MLLLQAGGTGDLSGEGVGVDWGLLLQAVGEGVLAGGDHGLRM